MTRSKFVSYLLATLFSLSFILAHAQAATLSATPSTVAPGGGVSAAWSGISNPTGTDWIGLYTPGAGDSSFLSWIYVSCLQSSGGGSSAGSCNYGMPFVAGTFELRLFANNGYNRLATSNPVVVGTALPVVTLVVTDSTATENNAADTGYFTVSRTGSTAAALTVNYTVSGSATNGTDYQTLSGSVTFPANVSDVTIVVTPIDDNLVEGDETVIVTLSANAAYTVGAPSSGTVTIVDDEPALPVVTLAVTDGTATENNAADTGVFTVSRTGSTAAALTVNYTVSGSATNGTDYQALSGSVTIPANASSAAITVTPIDDILVEGNETVSVTLSANAAYTVGAPSSGTVTIIDNDVPPGPSLTATPSIVALSGSVTAAWSGITTPTSRDWIALTTAGSSNTSFISWTYVSCSQSPGAAANAGSCNYGMPGVTGTYELRLFANDSFNRLATSNPIAVGASQQVTIAVTDATATENNAADMGLFTVTRSGSTASALTVNYAVSGTATNGVDYQTLSGSVTIAANASSATINVIPIDDGLAEGNETVTVTLSSNAAYTVGSPSSGTVTIVDDEPIVTLAATDAIAMENNPADTGVFTVSRTGSTAAALTVFYALSGSASNGVDYQSLPGSVTIPANASSAAIVVTAIDNHVWNPNKIVRVTLSANAAYSVGSSFDEVTIVDPQLPLVLMGVLDGTATENNPADTGAFNVTRRDPSTPSQLLSPPTPLTVFYTVSGTATNGVDYQNLPGSVTIPANASSATITVTPIDDNLLEGSETVVVTLSQNAAYSVGSSQNSGTVTIIDDEAGLATLTLAVTDATATENNASDTGVFTVSRTGTTAAALTVNYSVGGSATNGTDYQTLSGSVTIPANASSATITVVPIDDNLVEGNETVVVTLSPNPGYTLGATVSGTVIIVDNDVATGATITANPASILPSGVVTASWSGITTPTSRDWIALATAGSSNTSYVSWMYVSCAQSPGAAANAGSCNYAVPGAAGTYELRLFANDSYNRLATSNPITVGPTTVTIAVTDGTATENNAADTGVFTVSRTGSTASALTVNYTVTGTATNGTDYQNLPGSVTIAANASSATITVVPIDDTLAEGNETVTVTLSPNAAYTVGSPSSGTVTIVDDEPIVTLTVTDNTATENNAADTGVFTVSRTGSTASALTVNYTVAGAATNGTDYQNLPGSVTIPVNASSATITVVPIDDSVYEGNETVIVTLSANTAYTLGSPSSGTVIIVDDEQPLPGVTLAVTDGTATENNASDTGIFTVSRIGSTAAPLTVNYTVGGTATNGVDYQTLSGSVVIPANASSATIVVTPIDDALPEGNETVTVSLSPSQFYTIVTCQVCGFVTSGTVTIVDDDISVVQLQVTDNQTIENVPGDTATFVVSRIGGTTTLPLTVFYTVGGTATNGVDYQTLPGSVTIPAGATSANIVVTPIDDNIKEGTESVVLTVTPNATYTLLGYPINPAPSATASIIDDDTVYVSIVATDATATENNPADTGVFTVSRSATSIGTIPLPVAVPLTVFYTVSGTATNGVDYQTLSGSVVIPANASSATIVVTPIDDNVVEGNETVIVTLSPDAAYLVSASASSATVTIVDDDAAPQVTLAVTDGTATENIASDTGIFTVSRTGSTTSALTVFYSVGGTATNGTDYQLLSGSVTLAANLSTATITVTPIDDNAVEGNETVVVTLSANAAYTVGSPSSGTVTIVDDDVPAGPSVAANPPSVAPGAALTASWSGIVSPTSTDWIALATSGAANNSYLIWTYVSCTQAAGAAQAAGSCSLTVPPSTASGTYELRLFANNTYTRLATSTSISVAPVVVGSSTLAAAILGVSYSQSLSATGGTGSYVWSQIGSSLQNIGLNLSPAGVISGTPTVSGNNFSFTAKAVDSLGASATRSFTLVVSPSPVLALASSVLTSAQVNVSYTFNLSATGGTAPYTYSIPSGGLPLGLSLSSSGVISGIPYSIGSTKFVVQVKDSVNATASATLILTAQSSGRKPLRGYWSFDDGTATDNSGFNPGSILVGSPQIVPDGISGNALRFDGASQYINASDHDLDAGSGELSIFAWVRTTQAGGLKMIVAQRDSSSSTNPGYQLFQNSNNALSYIIGDTSGNVVRKDSTGPQINDGNWHFVGVVFNRNATATGVLYVDGVPATNGTGDVTIVTGDNVAAPGVPLRIGAEYQTNPTHLWNGDIDEVSLFTRRFFTDAEVLALYNRTLTITSDTLPAGGVNVNYNQRLAGTGGVAPYTWSVVSGALPAGLQPITPDGVLTGSPTASGTFNFTIQLTDALGTPTQKAFTLVINNLAPQQLLSDNFSGGAGNWQKFDQGQFEGPGNWVVITPDFVQTSNIWDGNFLGSDPVKPGTFAFYTGALASSDYDFSVRMMSEDNDALGVMFRYQDPNNYYRFSMDSERRYRRLVKVVGGVTTILKKSDLINNAEDSVLYEIGQVYNVRVSVIGSDIIVYVDNKQILHAVDSSLVTGNKVALYTWGNEYAHFGDVVITTP